jgi:hypothetical protein
MRTSNNDRTITTPKKTRGTGYSAAVHQLKVPMRFSIQYVATAYRPYRASHGASGGPTVGKEADRAPPTELKQPQIQATTRTSEGILIAAAPDANPLLHPSTSWPIPPGYILKLMAPRPP